MLKFYLTCFHVMLTYGYGPNNVVMQAFTLTLDLPEIIYNSTHQGEQLCQIIVKSMHNVDKVYIRQVYHLTIKYDLDLVPT